LAAVGESSFDVSRRLATPVWESARGTSRHWQDAALVGDAFWAALDVAADDAVVEDAEPWSGDATRRKKVKKSKRKKPIRSVHHPVGHEHQTVTEQIATFLALREPFQVQTEPAGEESLGELLRPEHLVEHLDLQVTGAEDVAGRACDVVHATVRPPGVVGSRGLAAGLDGLTYELWVDSERLVILRAVKLVDGEPAEIVEFLDIAFDD
jgi:CelD/BcsL family acetyltransferase involved in cellulose biosynthesis